MKNIITRSQHRVVALVQFELYIKSPFSRIKIAYL